MKIYVNPKQVVYLLNKLSIISKARFVLLISNADDQTICFHGANESVQVITESIECKVEESGEVDFDYFVLKDLISSLRQKKTICLDCSDNQIKVKSENSRGQYNIAVKTANKVVTKITTPNQLPKVIVTVDSEELGRNLACAIKSVPKNDCRVYLNGLNFEYQSKTENDHCAVLHLVATDGSRMTVNTLNVQKSIGTNQSFIVPNNANNPFVDYLLKLTSTYSGIITINFSDSFAELVTPEGDRIRTLLIEQKYADWKRLMNINTENYIPITLNRVEMQMILNRIKTLTLKFEPVCNVSFEIKKSTAKLSIKNKNSVVSASEVFEVTNPSNSEFVINFNSQFMLDMLSLERLEDATLWFHGKKTAQNVIRYYGNNLAAVLMPTR